MIKDADKLHSVVGRDVSSVAVEVQFYGVETKGCLSAVLIEFADGARYAMGCAGDGSVSVYRGLGDKGSAPGFVAERRSITDLTGEFRGVSTSPHAMQLKIGEHELLLVNQTTSCR